MRSRTPSLADIDPPMRRNPDRFMAAARFLAVVGLASLWAGGCSDGADEAFSGKTAKEWRQAAVERPRRIIVNNDGNEPVMIIREPTAEALLAPRVGPLAGTQVDSLFYCTWSSGFGLFTHFTKVGQVFTSRADRHANNQMPALREAGIDPLRVMNEYARAHGMEFFWSMRMNDNHDGYADKYGPALFEANELKMAHPEYLLGSRGQKLAFGSWSAVNYARPEIRDLAFRYVEEVCQNYDIDGVELDFFRHPVFFPSTTRGELATAEELEMMTGLLRRIRAMADEAGRWRGRPILIAVRVPDSVAYAKAVGLDLETWLSDDLADLLIVGGYFRLNDWERSVELARRHGVKVYASLDDARVADPDGLRPSRRMTDAAYRGRAAVARAAGVDGLYFFNQFNPRRPIWREVGEAATLDRLDKDYFASVLGVGNTPMQSNLPLGGYRTVETLAPDAPRVLTAGQPETASIRLAEPADSREDLRLDLRIRLGGPEITPESLTVACNDVILTDAKRDGAWLVYRLSPGSVRQGVNAVRVELKPGGVSSVSWLDLMVSARHVRGEAGADLIHEN